MTVNWDKTLLVGDVGGTNARFAIAHMIDGKPVLEHHESFPASEHPTFLGGVKAFIDGCEVKPTGGVIAGPPPPAEDGVLDPRLYPECSRNSSSSPVSFFCVTCASLLLRRASASWKRSSSPRSSR